MSGKQLPFLFGTLLCFMSAPPVASLPIVRRATGAPPALDVQNMDGSIEINADGIGATKNTNEPLANQDAATNAMGSLSEHGAVATKKKVQATTCEDSDVPPPSGLTCKKLAGLVLEAWGSYDNNFCHSEVDYFKYGVTIKAGEAAAHCCKTCATAPVSIYYGRKEHGATPYGDLMRPEELRTFQCDSAGKCKSCTSKSNCWHGGRRLDITVAGGTAFKFYRAEVHTKCPPGADAYWLLRPYTDVSELKVYVNDVLGPPLVNDKEWKQTMVKGESSTGDGNPQKLHIDFTPANPAQDSSAECEVAAKRVSAAFERCQDKKNCLRVFGDGSEAGFAMRNSNENQWLCVSGGGLNGQALVSKCTEWKDCMLEEKNELLETVVKTADIAAVAIEPKIALGSSKVAFLEKMAKKEEFKANQEHYILGEDNANKCPEGSTKIQTEAECKVAASELGKGQWGWNRAWSTATRPSKCWKGNAGNANWNPHAVGSAASGRRPICKVESEGQKLIRFLSAMLHASREGEQKGNSLVGSAVAAEKQKATLLTVTFEPGQNGITADGDTGRVTQIVAHSHAQGAGVKIGMTFKELDGQEYSSTLLDEKIGGIGVYKVSFAADVQLEDKEGCFDPGVGDMESWECDCMDAMIDKCGEIDEECFAKLMCAHENVCESWKETDDHCPNGLMESMANRSILQTSTKTKGKDMNKVDLDNSLGGKCTSETQ